MASLEQARQVVEASFAEALRWADSCEKRSFTEFESKLWSLLLALGRALVVLFLVRQVHRPRPASYVYQERQYELGGIRTTWLGTLFGKVEFARPVGRLVKWRRRAVDLPVDRELGLDGGFSLGVVLEMVRSCAQMAFKTARETFPASSRVGAEPEGRVAHGGRRGRAGAAVPRTGAAAGGRRGGARDPGRRPRRAHDQRAGA